MKTVNFPIKYKKDIAMKMKFEEFYEFCKQYKNIKIEPDVIVIEFECLTGTKVAKNKLNKILTKKQ